MKPSCNLAIFRALFLATTIMFLGFNALANSGDIAIQNFFPTSTPKDHEIFNTQKISQVAISYYPGNSFNSYNLSLAGKFDSTDQKESLCLLKVRDFTFTDWPNGFYVELVTRKRPMLDPLGTQEALIGKAYSALTDSSKLLLKDETLIDPKPLASAVVAAVNSLQGAESAVFKSSIVGWNNAQDLDEIAVAIGGAKGLSQLSRMCREIQVK